MAASTPNVMLVDLASLHPDPRNPRDLDRAGLEHLKTSLLADPEYLWVRPVLAHWPSRIIYAGTQRWRVAVDLATEGLWPAHFMTVHGHAGIPAIIAPVDSALRTRRMVADNGHAGTWNEDLLGELLYDLKVEQGFDVHALGIDSFEVDRVLDLIGEGPEHFEPLPDRGEPPLRLANGMLECANCHHQWKGTR